MSLTSTLSLGFSPFSIFIISTDDSCRSPVPVNDITLVPHFCQAVKYKLGAKVHQMKDFFNQLFSQNVFVDCMPGFSLMHIMTVNCSCIMVFDFSERSCCRWSVVAPFETTLLSGAFCLTVSNFFH